MENLRPDTGSYDLRGAYKADFEPELIDGNYRMATRNPETGIYYKSLQHPTTKKSLEADREMGYTPFFDPRTGRYGTRKD